MDGVHAWRMLTEGVPRNAGSCMAMVKARTAISMRPNDHAEHCVKLRFICILAMDAQCNHAGIFASPT